MSIDKNLIALFNEKKYREFIFQAEAAHIKNPKDIDLIVLIAISFAECSDLEKAKNFITKGYQLNKTNENVLYNFAKISEELSDDKKAEDLYGHLLKINPTRIDALNNLARIKLKHKAYDNAEYLFKKCLHISSKAKLAYQGLADLYNQTDQRTKELEILKLSYENDKNDHEVILTYCSSLIKNNQIEYARSIIDSSYERLRDNADFILLRANLDLKLGDLRSVRKSLDNVLSKDPENEKAISLLGICYLRSFDFNNARHYIYKALDLCSSPEAFTNAIFYNSILDDQNETLRLIEVFLETYPDNNNAKTLKGFHLLRQTQFKPGWDHYKYRNSKDPLVTYIKNNNQIDEWDLRSSVDNILLIADQGIGDEVMFVRILDLLDITDFTLCVDDRLLNIVKNSYPEITIVGKKELHNKLDKVNSYTHYKLLADLCSKYIISLDTIGELKNPYLRVNRELDIKQKEKIIDNKKINVGISWHTTNESRFTANLTGNEIKKLSENQDYNLINLQYGNHEKVINQYKLKSLSEIDYKNDIDKIFEIINTCDFVITIDNCIAHFSGAIGKKTYLLLPINSDWRWFGGNKKTIWYDSITIFKQDSDYSYTSAIDAIIKETKSLS